MPFLRIDALLDVDIIGDVHGCYDELTSLLERMGYLFDGLSPHHPAGRKAVFVGDFCDRGPKSPEVLSLVCAMVEHGEALGVAGNHDNKLMRYLAGNSVTVSHGLDKTVAQLLEVEDREIDRYLQFLKSLPHHLILDSGKLVVAHAGIDERFIGQDHKTVKAFTLYGKTNGATDEFGLPVRLPWENDHSGSPVIVYGHTPGLTVRAVKNTYNIDTGCVFGGSLTALRYPSMELVQVPASRVYDTPTKPLA